MAIWQFTIALIPVAWSNQPSNTIESLFSEDGYETAKCWAGHQPKSDWCTAITSFLPKGKSWNNDLLLWGDDETTDVQAWYSDNVLESINVRIDLRGEVQPILEKLVKLTEDLECILFWPEGRMFLQPRILDLKRAIVQSRPYSFVKNPEAFLQGINAEGRNAT